MKEIVQCITLCVVVMCATCVAAQTVPPAVGSGGGASRSLDAVGNSGRAPVVSGDSVFQFYATNLRGVFFTASLTLASFLLAATTFIVINLKKEVYDSPDYRRNVSNAAEGTTQYGPLRRLSSWLIGNITVALISSLLQMSVGIAWESRVSAWICMGSMALTVALLFVSLGLIHTNLRDWFDAVEAQAERKPE